MLRVHGNIIFTFDSDSVGGQAASWNTGLYFGVMVAPISFDTRDATAGNNDAFDPGGPAAQLSKWMYWNRIPLRHASIVGETVPDTVDHVVQVHEFDIKSKRIIKGWGETLVACWRGSGSDPCDAVVITTSVLLALP